MQRLLLFLLYSTLVVFVVYSIIVKHLKRLFPCRLLYNRFVELENEVLLPLTIFIKKVILGTCTDINSVISPLRVFCNQRILIYKTFGGISVRGKCSMGWFWD